MSPIVRLIIVLLTIIFLSELRIVSGEAKSPPYFVKQPPKEEILFYVEDEDSSTIRSFEILCEAQGDPEPEYFYTKNGVLFNWTTQGDRITREKGSGTLRIGPTQASDVGQYQCFAENIWGIATSNSVFARKIELNSFKNEKPVKQDALEGQPFHLSCQSPDGYPKPKTNWLIQDFTGRLIGIEDPRITVDPEGTLWFSNVTLDDAIEDSVYACAVTSPYISEVKTGAKVILNVNPMEESSEDNEVAPVKQYTSKTEETATFGKKARLYCIFGGTPLPTMTWYKNGNRIQLRGSISKDGGKSIEIKRVAVSDEGNYTCQASNGVGDPISHTITLKVLVEPRLTKKPENVVIDEQETVEFHCQATGNPAPEIIWIHNGKPLSEAPFNPRRAVSSNSIIIEKLWKNDTGNYGCNATNSVGYVYHEAFVNVLAEPPKITQLPQNQEVIEGGTVTMSCRAEGSPKPQITWMRNDAELRGDRFITTKNGDLTIKNAALDDTGEYTCLAQNKISLANISANLSVREHTRIPPELAPSYTEVPAGEPAILKCSAIIDPALELTISWQRNQESIDSSDQRYVQTNNSSLTILKTSELDSGVYTCVAHTRLDYAKAEASLVVQNIPNPPAIVSLLCNAREAVISWKNTGDNRAPIINYIIQHNKISVSDTWEEIIPNRIPAADTAFAVAMAPWTNYTFRVLAVNKIGKSLPSEPSSICSSSPPDIPYQNPKNISVKATNESKALQISWEPIPKTDHNGPGFHYQVSWKKDTPESEWENQTIPNWETGEHTLPKVSPFTKYLVKVTSGNDLGQSAIVSDTLEHHTPPDIPFKNPDNVTIQTNNPKTLDIAWQPMPKNDHNGPGFYYNVSWKKDTPDSEWQSHIITQPEKGEYKVQNVEPNEKYLVTVVAGNDQGSASPPSEPFILQTLPDVPEKHPENVTISSTNPKTLEISWKPVPKDDHNGPGFHYQVSWKKDTPELEWQNQTILNWETGEYTISEVSPFTKYLVKVTAGNDLGQSTIVSEALEYNTPPDIPFKNPDNVTIQTSNPKTLDISWQAMPKNDQNGPGFYYNVSWKKDTPDSEWQSQIITQPEKGEYIVQNVQPYEKYLVTVVAGNEQGQASPPPEPFILQTPPDVPDKNPENVTVHSLDPKTLEISWKPMPKNDHNGPGFHYNVFWKKDVPGAEWENQTISQWDTEKFTIPNTTPHTKYLVKVISGNDLGPSALVSEAFEYNTPAYIPFKNPDNLTGQATHPTFLEISWTPMPKIDQNGPGFYYNISWKKDTPDSEWQSQIITQPEKGEYIVPNVQPYEKYLVNVVAGNDQGPAESPLEPLILQTSPDIPYKNPENVTIRAINSTTLQISWKPMPKNDHNGPGFHYNVLWKRDIPEELWESRNVSEWETGEYTVHDVLPYEKYLVTIIAGNEIGPANQNSESISYTTPATIPFKNPENVTVRATGPTTSLISWKPMPKTDHNGPGFYYSVSWKIDSPEGEWESQNITEWETGEFTINLPPYEKHLVTVVAGNDQGQCTQPPITVEGYYEEDVPLEAPANLALVEILSSTKANISWNRVPKAALRGNFQGYKIETWPEHDQQKGNITEIIVEQNFDNFVIDKLTPNTKNKIRIQVYNGKHAGPFSEELEIDTPEGVPEPVQSAEASPVGSSALTLAWEPPLITNGRLTGYKIHYEKISEAESDPIIEYSPQITDPNETAVKLTGLEPDTNYKIIIQATTNAGDGEKMEIEQKTRPRPSLPMITPDFQLERIESENSTAVKVIWLPCGKDADTNCADQPIGSEFRVDYGLKDENDFQTVVEKNDHNVTIRNLQPHKEYKFMVSSVDGTLVANSETKFLNTSEIPTISEKPVALKQTELEKIMDQSDEPMIQSTEKSSPESVPKVEPIKDSGNFTIMWLVILLSIALLVVVITLIVIYLKKLTEGDKYIVREQEIKNRRPDWPEDPDFPDVTQPLNEEVPVDPSLPSKPDKDGMVMIPLN